MLSHELTNNLLKDLQIIHEKQNVKNEQEKKK